MSVKISIGIPFYNNEKTLALAIKSVIWQTFTDWELFLIDDGSTDSSVNIAKEFAYSDNRIKLICDNSNKGLVYRLNQIVEISNGSYIARMDADDVMLPERLEKQLQIFNNNSEIDIVATAAYTIDYKDNPVSIRDTEQIELKDKKNILKKSLLIHPSILVKKEWYKLNKYDKDYIRAEDFELWCRTIKNTVFFRITEPLMLYREGNINIRNYVLSMKTLRKILRNYSKDILSRDEFMIEILKTYLKSLAYKILGFFNVQFLLSKKRGSNLTESEKHYVKSFVLMLKEVE